MSTPHHAPPAGAPAPARPHPSRPPLATGRAHLAATRAALHELDPQVDRIDLLGQRLASVFRRGGRLLAAGNGGSAAHAQHLTSELVGRYRDDRTPLAALCLHGDASSVTAIVNDFGPDEVFARQVAAHGRRGDVLVALSTSGRSPNLLAAARTAATAGLWTVALTGARPNPLADLADDVVAVDAATTAAVQEAHQVVVHLVCAALDVALGVARPAPDAGVRA